MAGNPTLPKENIDEVILGLLALEPNEIDELDYQTYRSYLKEFLVEISTGKKIDSGEAELIQKEFKRVKGKTGRFKISAKKSKVTATGLGLGGVRKQVRGAQQRLMLAPVGGVPKEKPEILKGKGSESDVLSRISNTLDSILKTLTDINKESRKRSDRERRDAEGKRRAGKEREFESKLFDGVKSAVKGILKPFESIWDRIVRFITNILIAKVLIKLLDWFSKKENQGKIRSLIRFFKDHWPTLLALYLRFGTGIGRFVGKLSSVLIKGAIKLGALAAKLAVKAGLKGFGGAARFLGGAKGKALGTALSIGADVAITAGTAAGIGGLASGDIKVPGFSGGGFSGGIKNFFGNMFSGLVKGPKGRDKVPAMLTDGEFVMSAGAVQKYGVDTLESMNAAGGGTNVPQIANGTTFAEGGGLIGGVGELRRKYDAKHGEGAYDKESAKRRAAANAIESPREAIARLRSYEGPARSTSSSPNTSKILKPQVNIKSPTIKASVTKPNVDPKRQAEREARSKARSEYLKVIKDMSHPDYDKAWNDPNYMKNLRQKYMSQSTAASPKSAPKSGTGYTPYVSPFAGARDTAFRKAQGITGASMSSTRTKSQLIGGGGGGGLSKRSGIYRGEGAKMVGGYGLKQQSFKDAPSTQIIKNAKGENVVGYKAMKGGKTTYVQGPKPGTGTTNIFERMGRMINPNAYKQSDALAAQKKYQQASAGSIASLKARGASQATIARRQAELKKGVKPLPKPKPKPKYNPAGGGMGGRRGSGSNPSNGQKPRSQNPTHSAKSTRTARSTLGVNKK